MSRNARKKPNLATNIFTPKTLWEAVFSLQSLSKSKKNLLFQRSAKGQFDQTQKPAKGSAESVLLNLKVVTQKNSVYSGSSPKSNDSHSVRTWMTEIWWKTPDSRVLNKADPAVVTHMKNQLSREIKTQTVPHQNQFPDCSLYSFSDFVIH